MDDPVECRRPKLSDPGPLVLFSIAMPFQYRLYLSFFALAQYFQGPIPLKICGPIAELGKVKFYSSLINVVLDLNVFYFFSLVVTTEQGSSIGQDTNDRVTTTPDSGPRLTRVRAPAEQRLYAHLFDTPNAYLKHVRPVMDHSTSVKVKLGVCIMTVDDIVEKDQTMLSTGCVKMVSSRFFVISIFSSDTVH